uniref:SH3 domain-containing protein n=1 Tax=Arion vulgaris TaxID=1028688 RepID=A0A0B7BDS1_9EUPU
MVNTPIPQNLKSEAKKAAKILREFSIPNAKTGPDGLIPAGILAKAKGLAIITVFKAGFLVTARGGSGIVIAKLERSGINFSTDWSAPSAIGLAGLGGGFEIGVEVTDFVIILNTRSAVDAFSKGGNLTLGGNFTIAAGPLGRNLEGDIAVRSPAAIYTYSKTKGLFAGISIEGSALIERKDANKKFYGKDIRAHQILNGEISAPDGCEDLYDVLKLQQEFAVKAVADLAKKQAVKQKEKIEGMSEYSQYKFSKPQSSTQKKSSGNLSQRSRSDVSISSNSSSSPKLESWKDSKASTQTARLGNSTNRVFADESSSQNKIIAPKYDPWKEIDMMALKGATASPPSYKSDVTQDTFWVVADFAFQAQLRCDLSLSPGDRIKVTTRTKIQRDWWEGIDSSGRRGIFPANYVHIVSDL